MGATCPRCGALYDARGVRWSRLAAMAGRVAGYRWEHRRPDNGKECVYDDAGPQPVFTIGATSATIMTTNREGDVPDEARKAG